MAFDLKSATSDPIHLPPRIILLGTPKVGKTTFAAQAPGAIMLPIKGEQGSDKAKCMRLPVSSSFAEVLGWLESLRTGAHDYMFAVIDSASVLEPLIWDVVCRKVGGKDGQPVGTIEEVLGGWGKGFVAALTEWRVLMDALDALRNERGMGCIITGHVKVKTVNDPQFDVYDAFQWDINQHAAAALIKWADVILFARQKQFLKVVGDPKAVEKDYRAIGSGEHCLYTQERPAHPGGGRDEYGHLPYELPLSFDAWSQAVADAMAKR